MPDDDDDDFYNYYSSDPPIDDDSDESENREETVEEVVSPEPTFHSSPTKRGKSLPLKIVKGTFMVLGYAFLAAVLLAPTKNNNKK